VETAVETRTVNRQLLLKVASGRMACAIASRILAHIKSRVHLPLNKRIKQFYSNQIFRARVRLDCPTIDDPAVQRNLEAASSGSGRTSVAWEMLNAFLNIFNTAVALLSQISVLTELLSNQRDGVLLATISFAQVMLPHISRPTSMFSGGMNTGVIACSF
jgi:hypothetical protein